MAGINSLLATISASINWVCDNVITQQQPYLHGDNVATSYSIGTNAVNNASGGADELISFLQIIAPGGSATINLQSVTNILQQVGVALVRVKGYQIRLLAASGNGAVSPVNGTACSSITVGGGGSPNTLELVSGTYKINNGGSHQHFDPSAAGFSAVTGAAKNVLITNNDGANAAAVQFTLIGATT